MEKLILAILLYHHLCSMLIIIIFSSFLFLSLLLPDIVLIGGRAEMDNNVNFEYSQLVQVHEQQTDSQIFKRHVERRTSRITFEKNQ